MTDRCRKTVRGVVGEAWSDAEIDDVLARLQRAKAAAQKADPLGHDDAAWEAAAREITKSEVMGALMERRLRAFSERAAKTRGERLASLPGDEADRLRAYDVGTEKQGRWSGASVDAEGRARTVALWGLVEKGLRDDPTLQARLVSKVTGRADPKFERAVAREMARLNGADIPATGEPGAAKAAKVFVEALEAGRRMQNAEGAWIGQMTGYIGRQSHDRMKVAGGFWRELKAAGLRGAVADWRGARVAASRRAFREWRDVIRPLLHEDTFKGVELDLAEAAELKASGVIDDANDAAEPFLYRVWSDIVTGRHETLGGLEEGDYRPPAGKARAVSQSRVLHFNGPDAWMDYAERFSQGGLYGAVMGDLDRAARNSALMARWGPSPEGARKVEVERLSQAARARGDTGAVDKLNNRMRQAEFDALTGAGNAPENLRLAAVARTIRMTEVLSKLGGVVLSALSDGSLAAQRMKRAGGTYLDGYSGVIRGVGRMQGEDGKAVADALDVGARSAAAHLTARFAASDGPLGWASWAQRLFYKVNLFEAWMDGARSGLAESLASIWGRQSDRAWSALEVGAREDFERFGIGEAEWELLRPHASEAGDGRRYLTTDAAEAIEPEALLAWTGWTAKTGGDRNAAVEAARADLKLRMQTLVGSVLDDAMTEARTRETVGLTRGLKPGTVAGEAVRFFTQFWGFSQAVIGRHLAPAARGYAGQSPVALMAHLIVASTALGYLSLQMKQLAKGRTPRGLENEEGESLAGNLFIASLLQGGGLGLYGDFLFGEASRTGLPATMSSLAGPAVSDAERLFNIVNKATWGDEDEKADAGADAVKFATTMAPGANLWYTRWALDYAVMWRMQEAMSPGYLARYEKRVREREGSDFLIAPTEAAGA